mmetsp:Transcript_53272/g.165483  ORF Transcript_53272/g.165483 Transcript_53272/m.165483 type:complete len:249 (+) Transcript_53272:371-1117(+)
MQLLQARHPDAGEGGLVLGRAAPPAPELLPADQHVPARPIEEVRVEVRPRAAPAPREAGRTYPDVPAEGLLLEVVLAHERRHSRQHGLQDVALQEVLVHVGHGPGVAAAVHYPPHPMQGCVAMACRQLAPRAVGHRPVAILPEDPGLPGARVPRGGGGGGGGGSTAAAPGAAARAGGLQRMRQQHGAAAIKPLGPLAGVHLAGVQALHRLHCQGPGRPGLAPRRAAPGPPRAPKPRDPVPRARPGAPA